MRYPQVSFHISPLGALACLEELTGWADGWAGLEPQGLLGGWVSAWRAGF
jgi:hypothetical protein